MIFIEEFVISSSKVSVERVCSVFIIMMTLGVVVAQRWSLVLVVLMLPLCYGDRVSICHHNKLDDVHNYLEHFNKPPLKSIKPRWGYNADIIDCAHIPQQPAFDYPLLKNHTIQVAEACWVRSRSRGVLGVVAAEE
ncbi:unnamed protein product [Camellia sinensis]